MEILDNTEIVELMNFQEFYPYMCRTKIHENKDIQMMFEAQREHLTPNHRGSATRIAKTGAVVSWTRCVAVPPVRRGLVGALGAGHCRAKRSEARTDASNYLQRTPLRK